MSLDTGRYQLYSTFSDVERRWEAVREGWQDAIQQKFDEDYWQPLVPLVNRTLSAIDRLSQVLNQARRECE